MNDDETETIALAIKTLEKGVSRILKRRGETFNDNSRHRIQMLIEHARHVLLELFKKRRSLKAFLRWFHKEWVRIEIDLAKHPVQILQHSMQHFLRCQDAFILLTSGECRHEYDMKLAKKTKFRSRLSTLQERDDGYTALYKGTGVYSGYGFDEFNNEIVGIRALLVKELKKYHKAPWDYLERQGGTELLENLLDQHEREQKELQHALQSLKRLMIENMTKRLKPKNLKFATQDKLERLSLSTKGQTIDLERRGDAFQIDGPLLPNENKNPDDWHSFSLEIKEEMDQSSIPPSKIQKRRRVIIDSDDGSDNDDEREDAPKKKGKRQNNKTSQASGLVVRVDSSRTNAEKEDSLAAIKSQVGISTQDLEQAREILEEENASTKKVFEDEKVLRLEKILRRVLARDEIDENEVWDARECLRYACMEAGNKYLWDSSVGCVEKAIENFEKAKEIVELQQKSQQKVTSSEASLFVQLNLFYLHGQALVNIGISLVDTSHHRLSIPRVKVMRAIEEFEGAKKQMAKLRSLAGHTSQSTSRASVKEANSYILKSKQLESLACRWMGRGLWLISEEMKAVTSFEEASQFLNDDILRKWQRDVYFEIDVFDITAEAIYATCDLADRCYSMMEALDHKSPSSRKKGHDLLEIITRALNRHIGIIESIELCSSPVRTKHFRDEYDISSIEDVLLYRKNVMKWWKEQCENEMNDVKPNQNCNSRLPESRSDSSSLKTKKILTSDGSRRKRYEKRRKASSHMHGNRSNNSQDFGQENDAVYALSGHYQPRPPVKFRRWGDEYLIAQQQLAKSECDDPHEETNSSFLTYPSIAPPKPVEFQV
ncbi:unnamed protein product [Pseudo-nitzschia multistriata]|uniref:Uncharacterized protein n=1 Tax=Pseudo-nitzschia multistriata TaxID=183589 RepID=A0A448ZEP3_9STRA|nr:unnamed protein product [Pseudo-nitzschia multistriata]